MVWNPLRRRVASAALTPPSAFVRAAAALVNCETVQELRESVGHALVDGLGCDGVVLLEPAGDESDLRRTWSVPHADTDGGLVLQRDSPLVRWLTVNDAPLRVGDGGHLWDEWSDQDRDVCRQLGAALALPFVDDDEIAGIALLGGLPGEPSEYTEASLREFAQHVAFRWRQLAAAERSAAQARSIRRAHQLGSVGLLAATLAHEVRNPLAAIRSMVQFIRDAAPESEERRRLLSNVMREVDRVETTVKRTLDLSKPDAGQQRPVDLAELAGDVVRFVEPLASRRQLTLAFDPPAESLHAFGDPGLLRQVLLNVVINACQACDAGGRVTVRVSAGEGAAAAGTGREHVRVEVTDSGAGMTPDQMAAAFRPFYTTKSEGTGLGLTFCRDTVSALGGTIDLQSAPGRGTSVVILLPGTPATDG